MIFYEDCDHGRDPIKTQKHVIFVRTVIMITVIIKKPAIIKIQKHVLIKSIAIMVDFYKNSETCINKED